MAALISHILHNEHNICIQRNITQIPQSKTPPQDLQILNHQPQRPKNYFTNPILPLPSPSHISFIHYYSLYSINRPYKIPLAFILPLRRIPQMSELLFENSGIFLVGVDCFGFFFRLGIEEFNRSGRLDLESIMWEG